MCSWAKYVLLLLVLQGVAGETQWLHKLRRMVEGEKSARVVEEKRQNDDKTRSHDDMLELILRRILRLNADSNQHETRSRELASYMENLPDRVARKTGIEIVRGTMLQGRQIPDSWMALDAVSNVCKLQLLTRLYAASYSDVYYELSAGSEQDYQGYLEWTIEEMSTNQTTSLQLPQDQKAAFLQKATEILPPVITGILSEISNTLVPLYGEFLNSEVRDEFEVVTKDLTMEKLNNDSVSTYTDIILTRLQHVYNGTCRSNITQQLQGAEAELITMLDAFNSLFVEPEAGASPNTTIFSANEDPETIQNINKVAKYIIAKARERIVSSARIFNDITAGDSSNGTRLTVAILEYIGARIYIEVFLRSMVAGTASSDFDQDVTVAKLLFTDPAALDKILTVTIEAMLTQIATFSLPCQNLFFAKLVASEVQYAAEEFMNRTAEEWVYVVVDNEKELGLQSASENETQELRAQIQELMLAVKPLMDQEVQKISAHIDIDHIVLSTMLEKLHKEIVTVKTLKNVMEVVMYNYIAALRDPAMNECQYTNTTMEQVTKPAMDAFNQLRSINLTELFASALDTVSTPRDVAQVVIATVQSLKDTEYVAENVAFLEFADGAVGQPDQMQKHIAEASAVWLWNEFSEAFGHFKDMTTIIDSSAEIESIVSQFSNATEAVVSEVGKETLQNVMTQLIQNLLNNLLSLPTSVQSIALAKMVEGGLISSLQMTKVLINSGEFQEKLINLTIQNWPAEQSGTPPTEQELNLALDSLIQRIRMAVDEADRLFTEFIGAFSMVVVPEYNTIGGLLTFTSIQRKNMKDQTLKQVTQNLAKDFAWHLEKLAQQSYMGVTMNTEILRHVLMHLRNKTEQLQQMPSSIVPSTAQALDESQSKLYRLATAEIFQDFMNIIISLERSFQIQNHTELVKDVSEVVGKILTKILKDEVSLEADLMTPGVLNYYFKESVPEPQYPVTIDADEQIVDILAEGEEGLVTLLDRGIATVVRDFAKESHTCKKAIAAQIFSGEAVTVLDSLDSPAEDWVYTIIQLMDFYSPEQHGTIEQLAEIVENVMSEVHERIVSEIQQDDVDLDRSTTLVQELLTSVDVHMLRVHTARDLLSMTSWSLKNTLKSRSSNATQCADADAAIERTIQMAKSIQDKMETYIPAALSDLMKIFNETNNAPLAITQNVIQALRNWLIRINMAARKQIQTIETKIQDETSFAEAVARRLAIKVVVELTSVFWDYIPVDLKQDVMGALSAGHVQPGGMLAHLLQGLQPGMESMLIGKPVGTPTDPPPPVPAGELVGSSGPLSAGGPIGSSGQLYPPSVPENCPQYDCPDTHIVVTSDVAIQAWIGNIVKGFVEGLMRSGVPETDANDFMKDVIDRHGLTVGLPQPYPVQTEQTRPRPRPRPIPDTFQPPCIDCDESSDDSSEEEPDTPNINVNIHVNGDAFHNAQQQPGNNAPQRDQNRLPNQMPNQFDPRTIIQAIRGLLRLHKVFVEAGVLPREDIQAMLFPLEGREPMQQQPTDTQPRPIPKGDEDRKELVTRLVNRLVNKNAF